MYRSKCLGKGVGGGVPLSLDWLLGSELLVYKCLWEAQGSSSHSPGKREHRFCVLSFLPGTRPPLPETAWIFTAAPCSRRGILILASCEVERWCDHLKVVEVHHTLLTPSSLSGVAALFIAVTKEWGSALCPIGVGS